MNCYTSPWLWTFVSSWWFALSPAFSWLQWVCDRQFFWLFLSSRGWHSIISLGSFLSPFSCKAFDCFCHSFNDEYLLLWYQKCASVPRASLGSASGKEPACQCRSCKRCGFDPWIEEISWRRAWQPTLLLMPGESHGQRSLAGYSP